MSGAIPSGSEALFASYCEARARAEASQHINDGMEAGRRWARFLAMFEAEAACDGRARVRKTPRGDLELSIKQLSDDVTEIAQTIVIPAVEIEQFLRKVAVALNGRRPEGAVSPLRLVEP